MRRGVWLVLALMGGVPAGALAQQQQQPAEQARVLRQVSSEVLQQQITELWQAVQQLQGDVALLKERAGGSEQAPAVGGSGRDQGPGSGAAQPGGTSQTGGAGQVGMAPTGDPAGVIIVEMPAPGRQSAGGTATPGNTSSQSGPATGGSGMGQGPQASAAPQVDEIFIGTVRSVTGDRLIMVDPSNQVYEFGLGAQTRIIGPRGHALSPQALEEGMLVRAVTEEAGVRNEVRSLQIVGPAPAQ
jgi:hypothetical protein